jgi:IS30 family transposase
MHHRLVGNCKFYGALTEELDAIALELNMRPRKCFDFKCPIEVMSELMAKYRESSSTIQ